MNRVLHTGKEEFLNRIPATRERNRRQSSIFVACQQVETRNTERAFRVRNKGFILPGENGNRAMKGRNPESLRQRTSKPTSLKRTVRGVSTAKACFRLPTISSTSYSVPPPLAVPPPWPSSSAIPVPRSVVAPQPFFILAPSGDWRSTAELGLSWLILRCDGDF